MTRKKTEQKAADTSRGLVFKWGTIFSSALWGEIVATQELFYKLYRKNTDIKSAVGKLQNSVGKDGFFFEKNSERIQEKKLSQAFKFFRLHKGTMIRDLCVSGNTFTLPIKNAFGDIINFQILDPRSMTILVDKYGTILKYVQRVGTDTETYEPDEIYHLIEMRDPDNESMGLSRVESIIYDVMGDNEAMTSNYAFFKNNAIPNTIVIFEDEIADDDYDKAIAELKKQFSGWANAGKVSTNTGIKDIKTIGQTNKDMQYVDLRRFTTTKVCAAIWVPETLLGYHNGVNYSTGDNNYRTFIEETVRPLEDLLAAFITEILQKEVDPEIVFQFVDDRDFDRTAKIDEYTKMYDRGWITTDEIRSEMGYDVFGLEATKKPVIRQGYEFVEDIGTTDLLPDNQAG